MMTEEMAATWKGVSSMRMSDGNVDLARAQKLVESMPMTAERKEKYFDYIKGKASEDKYMRNERDDANNRQFMNTLITNQKNGQGLDNALKLAASFGKDPYQKQQYEDIAKKLYDKPIVEDMDVKLAIYNGIKDGTLSDAQLHDYRIQGKISPNSWLSFAEDLADSRRPGGSKLNQIMEPINLLAESEFKDKKTRDQYKYTIAELIKKKGISDGDVAYKLAKEQLQDAPGFSTGNLWQTTLKHIS